MISYSLKCAQGHRFDSWFQSAAAFDTLKRGGHLACAVCGSGEVDKAVMAPAVSVSKAGAVPPVPAAPQGQPAPAPVPMAALPQMPEDMRAALAKLKRHVEANSDYVGRDFARQARDMHLGDLPERPIYGEVSAPEARSLVEDGVPVLPLPFTPAKKAN